MRRENTLLMLWEGWMLQKLNGDHRGYGWAPFEAPTGREGVSSSLGAASDGCRKQTRMVGLRMNCEAVKGL